MSLQKTLWGTTESGQEVYRYLLSNKNGMQVELTNIGCSILSIMVPDRDGKLIDVALGFDTIGEYENNSANFGCVVGRYGNRIRGGQFSFGGRTWQLEQNEGNNHLHGASGGYAFRYWPVSEEGDDHLTFRLESPDGDGGYPGDLTALVTYSLSEDNGLTLSYRVTTSSETVCNLTNHNYFNLSGAGNGDVLDHELMIQADSITEIDKEFIPTGVLLPVKDTALDFNTPKAIGRDIHSSMEQMVLAGGYDHNFVFRKTEGPNASAYAPKTGILMEVFTNSPGVQLYTANFMDGTTVGKNGVKYPKHGGFCLETQLFPDSVNQPSFPSCVVTKDSPQDFHTTYRFSIR